MRWHNKVSCHFHFPLVLAFDFYCDGVQHFQHFRTSPTFVGFCTLVQHKDAFSLVGFGPRTSVFWDVRVTSSTAGIQGYFYKQANKKHDTVCLVVPYRADFFVCTAPPQDEASFYRYHSQAYTTPLVYASFRWPISVAHTPPLTPPRAPAPTGGARCSPASGHVARGPGGFRTSCGIRVVSNVRSRGSRSDDQCPHRPHPRRHWPR